MSDGLDDRLDAIYEAVLDYEGEKTAALVRREIGLGTDIHAVLDDALIAAMDEVGDLFGKGVLFVPEMLMAAKAMKSGLDVLQPLLAETDAKPKGTVLLGTVHRDLHDIGKNLVGMMLEGAGFQVIDLGVDVPPERFLDAAHEHQPDVIGLSALLTTTMPAMRRTVEIFRKQGYNGRIIVGGAPVTKEFAAAVGADGQADDAPAAAALAKSFLVE